MISHAIRVVLADDHYLVREGVRRLLETVPSSRSSRLRRPRRAVRRRGGRSCRTSSSPTSACRRRGVDEGIQAAERLRESAPGDRRRRAEPVRRAALRAGAARARDGTARLSAEGAGGRPRPARRRRSEPWPTGGSVIDPKVVEALVAANVRAQESPLHELTPRERDVLGEMAEGKNNAAIAEALFLTERSVEKVIHSIFLKLGLELGALDPQAGEGGRHVPRRGRLMSRGAAGRRHDRRRCGATRRGPRRGRPAG